jgi:retron-type reverse transcriptase
MGVVTGDGRVERSQPVSVGQSQEKTVNPLGLAAVRSDHPEWPEPSSQPVRVDDLWEQVFSKANLTRALRRVERNKGAPGVDGVTTDQFRGWLNEHWDEVRRALDVGTYRPSPVRRVEIPKPDGGVRLLGVPTVLDRLVQQAIAQVLEPIFDPGFSQHSYGFRPGRGAHQAVEQSRVWLQEGWRWVVDVDLDKFFDRVNHDKLMHRVARRVADKRLLKLVHRYLQAGVMVEGVKQASAEGTPQGSPLSPLLSNIMLDDLDRELERRGHRFVRYADDLVRHEALCDRVEMEGLHPRPVAAGRVKLGAVRGGRCRRGWKAAPTTTGRAGIVRRLGSGKQGERVYERNQRWTLRKRRAGSNLTDRGRSAAHVFHRLTWGTTPGLDEVAGREVMPKACGVGMARLPGKSWAPDSPTGQMVNVGTARWSPSPPLGQSGGGKAHRRLMAAGWGGAFVVVRARESRAHGEGRQQDRSCWTGMPGGRR